MSSDRKFQENNNIWSDIGKYWENVSQSSFTALNHMQALGYTDF